VKLRIYADFNSCASDSRGMWCWRLRHDGHILDEMAGELGLFDSMPVTLYYEDESEEFECDATLGHLEDPQYLGDIWVALFDEKSFRHIR
jgi:hypothetical protein